MSTSIKNWAIGKDVAVTLTPFTVSSAGVVTLGTAQTVSGYIDDIRLQIFSATDKIIPVDADQSDTVQLYNDFRLVLREKKRRRTAAASSSAANGSILPWFCGRYRFAKIVCTLCSVDGAALTGEVYTIWAMWTDIDDGVSGPGGQMVAVTFEPVVVVDSGTGEQAIVSLDDDPTS